MLFALLVLATPRIGPPPNTGPFKPAPKPDFAMELGDDSAESGFPPVSGGLPGAGLPRAGLPGEGLLGSKLRGGGVLMPGCCGPGVGPKTGPLFKLMSVW